MARRGHNEGSIYKRESDGKWVGSVSLGYDSHAKRQRKVFYGATRREVQLQVNKAVQDYQHGLPVASGKQTVEQFVTQWLEDTVKPNVRPATYRGYEIQVRVHILPALGKLLLTKLG